jgi:nitrogen fixation protein FixH
MSCCGAFISPLLFLDGPKGSQMMGTIEKPPRQITGRFVLLAMVGFFGVVAAVNATMMTAAIRTMPGLEVKNSYVASQRYNGDIAAMRAQQSLGWNADARLRLKGADASVTVDITDAASKPVTGLAISARLAHPVDRNADHMASLTETAPGHYAATFPGVQRGAWDMVIENGGKDEEHADTLGFRSRSRVFLTE